MEKMVKKVFYRWLQKWQNLSLIPYYMVGHHHVWDFYINLRDHKKTTNEVAVITKMATSMSLTSSLL